LLRYRSYAVVEAADGAEGFALARKERPDLIFSDIIMPTMDGFELARRLRGDAELAATPIVFYTASYHGVEAMLLAESCGDARELVAPRQASVGVLEEGSENRLRVGTASGLAPDLERHAAPPVALGGVLGRAFRERRPIRLAGDELRAESTGLPHTVSPKRS